MAETDLRANKWEQVGNPRVRGRCPSCDAETLFLGNNGYVTCSVIGCKDPGAPTDLLALTKAERSAALAAVQQEAEARVTELLTVLKEYVEWFGAVHGQECPGDDTCSCIGGDLNARVNAAIRKAEVAQSAPKAPRPEAASQSLRGDIEKCDLECGNFWAHGRVCRHGRTAEQMR